MKTLKVLFHLLMKHFYAKIIPSKLTPILFFFNMKNRMRTIQMKYISSLGQTQQFSTQNKTLVFQFDQKNPQISITQI